MKDKVIITITTTTITTTTAITTTTFMGYNLIQNCISAHTYTTFSPRSEG
jgi:hypothetical protein